MSILKSILHHWNKTTNSYDTLHPETEVAQITDWSQGIVNTLASTALGSLISTLSSDSLMAKLMKLVLDASGVKYLIDTNGYVCFGSLFGGLIIQWIKSGHIPGPQSDVSLPLTMSRGFIVTANDVGSACVTFGAQFINPGAVRVWHLSSLQGSDYYCNILAVGK